MVLVSRSRSRCRMLRHVPDPQRRGQLDPRVRPVRRRPALLGFIAVVIVFATTLIIWRLPLLRSEHRLESMVSREATFLFNNLLLLALAFAILWGVRVPAAVRGGAGRPLTVSAPYYNFFLVAFGLPLLLLIGIGPLIAWRRASLGSLWRDVPLAGDLGAGRRRAAGAARLRLEPGRAGGVLAVRVRDDHDRARVRPRHVRPAGDRRRLVAAARWSPWSAATGAATAATSCTWRWCCWWSASPPRAPTRQYQRGDAGAGRVDAASTATRSPTRHAARAGPELRRPRAARLACRTGG